MTETEYERPPEEDEGRPRRPRKLKKEPYMIVRVPWCYTPIKVTDNQLPDDEIERFVAEGRCDWLEKNDPELAAKIRVAYNERMSGLQKPQKRRYRR